MRNSGRKMTKYGWDESNEARTLLEEVRSLLKGKTGTSDLGQAGLALQKRKHDASHLGGGFRLGKLEEGKRREGKEGKSHASRLLLVNKGKRVACREVETGGVL